MPTDHSLIAQHSIRHRFPYSLQLCCGPSGKSGQLPFLSPFPKALLARAQPCAEPLHCNGQQRMKLRCRSCFLLGGVLKARGEGLGKQQGQQNAGQDLGSPRWEEPRLLRLTKPLDQYVKEKEGRERVIRKKRYFPLFLFKFHGQSWHKWCGAHIFSIFVQEIAWPNSFCLQCVYCLKIQPLTWCSDIRQTLSMLILQM